MRAACDSALHRRGLSCCGIVTALITLLWSSYLIFVFQNNKCNVSSLLLPLLRTSAKHFSSVTNTSGYWLDYGSLLGAWRDGGIIPWEFDLDMGIFLEDCDKYLALKPAMEADGLYMYKRGDYVAQKKNIFLGYDAYLHKACARIYDSDHKYYIDFDWNKRFTYAEAQQEAKDSAAKGLPFDMPRDYKESDGDIMCNIEAWEPGTSGGCRLISWVLPLQPIDVLGVQQWVHAKPELNLEAMYGPNWRTPTPKGYKILICSWMPLEAWKFFFAWLFASALPYAMWRGCPLVWEKMCVALGRKPLPHKYSVLPLQSPARLS